MTISLIDREARVSPVKVSGPDRIRPVPMFAAVSGDLLRLFVYFLFSGWKLRCFVEMNDRLIGTCCDGEFLEGQPVHRAGRTRPGDRACGMESRPRRH